MPTLENVLPELEGVKIFSLCDTKDGFLQVKLDSESTDLTTFWTPYGKYKWLRMPFGLSSSPEEFQRRLSDALAGLDGTMIVADNIMVYGKGATMEEARLYHNNNLRNLFERARETNLKLNKDKCRFLLSELQYIGHIISSESVKKYLRKTSAIQDVNTPTDGEGVRRFLGHINYLLKFIPNCSAETEPLRRLIGTTKVDFSWGKDQERASKKLKQLAVDDFTLQYFKPVL